MGWYRTGTISGNSGSNVVTGSGTNFIDTAAGVNPGDALIIGNNLYEVAGVNSGSQLTLATNLLTSFSGSTYQIATSVSMSNESLTKKVSAAMDRILTSIANWMTILTGTGTVSITPYGSSQSYSGLAWPEISTQLASKASRSSNLADLTDIPGARANLGVSYGSAAGTVTQGNDPRLSTVNNNSGGTITSSVNINGTVTSGAITSGAITSGAITASGSITTTGSVSSSPTAGLSVVANNTTVNNRVEINNTLDPVNAGDWTGWSLYRWFTDSIVTGAKRSGDTKIQSYTIQLTGSSSASWQFLAGGNAVSSGSWINGSDERHKTKIKTVSDPLSAVLSWRGATYDKKDGLAEVGLIAQDVEKCCAEAVTTNGDRKFMDGTVIPDFKYLNTTGVSAAYHTEAIKTLFELVSLAITDKDKAMEMIAQISSKSKEYSEVVIKDKKPYKGEPPVLEVPSSGGLGIEETSENAPDPQES